MDRRNEVEKTGKHKIPFDFKEREEAFFERYDEYISEEAAKKLYAGVYGTGDKTLLGKSALKNIWDEFVFKERRDFIIAQNTIGIEDILNIGIDKFIVTMGWRKPSDVTGWRNNVIRVGICPHCKDQFVPLIFQTNQGLCNHCRPLYSIKAISNFVKKTTIEDARYYRAHRDALMNFYIIFYNDDEFRKLFMKSDPFAQELEVAEIETPQWLAEELGSQESPVRKEVKDVTDNE